MIGAGPQGMIVEVLEIVPVAVVVMPPSLVIVMVCFSFIAASYIYPLRETFVTSSVRLAVPDEMLLRAIVQLPTGPVEQVAAMPSLHIRLTAAPLTPLWDAS